MRRSISCCRTSELIMFISLIRSLDGVFYASALLLLFLIHPAAGRNELGQLGVFSCIPPLLIAWAVWRMPARLPHLEKWPSAVTAVRCFSLALAGLYPFAVWSARVPQSGYLFVNALLAVGVGIGVLFHLNRIIQLLAIQVGDDSMAVEAQMTRFLVFWLSLVPFLAGCVVLLIHMEISGRPPRDAAQLVRGVCPSWALLILFFPVFFSLSVLMRGRSMLARCHERLGPRPGNGGDAA